MLAKLRNLLLVIAVLVGIYFLLPPRKRSLLPPPVPVVHECQDLALGMKRIGNRYGIQFDVPTENFNVREGWGDMPPTHGFDVSQKGGRAFLEISLERLTDNMAIDPIRVFSVSVEKRPILDDKGQTIGQDDWGHLDSGERWRKLEFRGRVGVKYGLVNESEARTFDGIINSACILPAPTS